MVLDPLARVFSIFTPHGFQSPIHQMMIVFGNAFSIAQTNTLHTSSAYTQLSSMPLIDLCISEMNARRDLNFASHAIHFYFTDFGWVTKRREQGNNVRAGVIMFHLLEWESWIIACGAGHDAWDAIEEARNHQPLKHRILWERKHVLLKRWVTTGYRRTCTGIKYTTYVPCI
jgi:hypothetical protein